MRSVNEAVIDGFSTITLHAESGEPSLSSLKITCRNALVALGIRDLTQMIQPQFGVLEPLRASQALSWIEFNSGLTGRVGPSIRPGHP